ncbi:MAG: type II secretion system protein GspE, partial [Lachnospiraceae bacterium]|nr:type II secretion system protein GspE [Lachnospiraceae bacterium]
HEIMTIDKEVRRMITESVQVEELKDYLLKKQEMKTLKQSALYYLRNGVTTVEEVVKVAYYEE